MMYCVLDEYAIDYSLKGDGVERRYSYCLLRTPCGYTIIEEYRFDFTNSKIDDPTFEGNIRTSVYSSNFQDEESARKRFASMQQSRVAGIKASAENWKEYSRNRE